MGGHGGHSGHGHGGFNRWGYGGSVILPIYYNDDYYVIEEEQGLPVTLAGSPKVYTARPKKIVISNAHKDIDVLNFNGFN
jgi:hypothetical protein